MAFELEGCIFESHSIYDKRAVARQRGDDIAKGSQRRAPSLGREFCGVGGGEFAMFGLDDRRNVAGFPTGKGGAKVGRQGGIRSRRGVAKALRQRQFRTRQRQ